MPVVACANSAGALFVLRLFGRVTAEDLTSERYKAALETCRGNGFSALLLFDPDVDLSMLDAEAVRTIRQHRKQQFEAAGLDRRAGAAVIESDSDARMIVPLWNALNESDPGLDLSFSVFSRLDPALEWLGIDTVEARQLIAQTGYRLPG